MGRLARMTVMAGTVLLIMGITLTLLFNPVWVAFGQDASGVRAITGWSGAEVRRVTDALVHDVLLGPPEFAVTTPAGQAVLGELERGHMRDVYAVMRLFALAVAGVGGAAVLVLVRNWRAPAAWSAVARASAALVVVGLVLALAVGLMFDQVWLVFHLVLFPQGNFLFDPATQRLTQLFPDAFWTLSAAVAVGVGSVLALGTAVGARRRAGRLARIS